MVLRSKFWANLSLPLAFTSPSGVWPIVEIRMCESSDVLCSQMIAIRSFNNCSKSQIIARNPLICGDLHLSCEMWPRVELMRPSCPTRSNAFVVLCVLSPPLLYKKNLGRTWFAVWLIKLWMETSFYVVTKKSPLLFVPGGRTNLK